MTTLTTTPARGIDMLVAALAWVDAEAAKAARDEPCAWDQEHWVARRDGRLTYCLGGYIAYVLGDFEPLVDPADDEGEYGEWLTNAEGDIVNVSREVAFAIGLDPVHHKGLLEELFHWENGPEKLHAVAERIVTALDAA